MIYIARPMDQADVNHGRLQDLEGDVGAEMLAQGLSGFFPTRPYLAPWIDPEAMYAISEFALRRCDALLAILPSGVPSLGVPMEIQTAHSLGKPVAVLGSSESLQLRAMDIQVYYEDEIKQALLRLRAMILEIPPSGPIVKWTGDPECEPVRAYAGDAGWDLIVSETTRIPLNGFADVPCGISVEFPPGIWGRITGRSSTIRRRKILVNEGVIDNGYRGPLFAACWNLDDGAVVIERGERIAQIIPYEVTAQGLSFAPVAELGMSDRNQAAFGSTGA